MAATDRPASNVPTRESDYVAWLTPRIPGQPWTAPAYGKLNVPMQAPRVFCMASGHDGRAGCTCLSEQGTRHVIEPNRCRMIAMDGQYERFWTRCRATGGAWTKRPNAGSCWTASRPAQGV